MYFLILNRNNRELLYSTYHAHFKENLSQFVYEFFISKGNKPLNDYQIGNHIRNELIFAVNNSIREIWSRKVPDNILSEIPKKN